MKDSKNMFPMNIITTVSDDRKKPFIAFNWHWEAGFCNRNANWTR